MSIIIHFKHGGFTAAKYGEALNQLNAAGQGSPEGRNYHVCYGDPNNLEVTDVWNSMEEFQAFGKTLIPILNSLELQLGDPVISEVHNVIIGEAVPA
jgi:hypothetical protein